MAAEAAADGERVARAMEIEQKEQYSGPAFRMDDAAVTSSAPSLSPSRLVQAALSVQAQNARCRSYCSTAESLAVPFLLSGSVCMKTGKVQLTKSHYRYA